MTIAPAIVLLAVGAILKWAVTAHVSWINLQTAGTVLFVLGIIALVLAVAYTFWGGRGPGGEPARAMRDDQDPRY